MICLIDADLVAYPVACTCNSEEEGVLDIALLRCDKVMQDIIDATDSSHYRAFLTGKNNFRKNINPEYKANRDKIIRPIYLEQCRDFLIQEWNAEVSEGCEADDLLGMTQKIKSYEQGHPEYKENTILCSLDKDLDMVPGLHYNWNKRIIYEVSELDGLRFFYKQLLIGDKSDNIFGIEGIGPVKASKLIDHLHTESEMYNVVRNLYQNDERLCLNMECLWIWH
jgi:5'-3' exonuclease